MLNGGALGRTHCDRADKEQLSGDRPGAEKRRIRARSDCQSRAAMRKNAASTPTSPSSNSTAGGYLHSTIILPLLGLPSRLRCPGEPPTQARLRAPCRQPSDLSPVIQLLPFGQVHVPPKSPRRPPASHACIARPSVGCAHVTIMPRLASSSTRWHSPGMPPTQARLLAPFLQPSCLSPTL